jgi:hypothetical protein
MSVKYGGLSDSLCGAQTPWVVVPLRVVEAFAGLGHNLLVLSDEADCSCELDSFGGTGRTAKQMILDVPAK